MTKIIKFPDALDRAVRGAEKASKRFEKALDSWISAEYERIDSLTPEQLKSLENNPYPKPKKHD